MRSLLKEAKGKKSFQDLLNPGKYQVFLFSCPATMPFSFSRHPWFVVNRKGDVSRWEIFWRPQEWDKKWGHLHKDFYSPVQGTPIWFFSEKYLWPAGKLAGYIEGDAGSVAQKMADLIEDSPRAYSYCDNYSLKGPNSNTYIQWVLNSFPGSGLRLPWNSFGKSADSVLSPPRQGL